MSEKSHLALLYNALKWYLCAQFLIYGPVAQLNRATAFNF